MLNELCVKRDYNGILQYCKEHSLDAIGDCIASHLQYTRHRLGDTTQDDLQHFLAHFRRVRLPEAEKIRVMPLCNWTNTFALSLSLSRLLPQNSKIQFVVTEPEYWLVLNAPPPGVEFDRSKTIVYQMEPYMEHNHSWGEWRNPDPDQFLQVNTHSTTLNALEWHVSLTADELLKSSPTKDDSLPLSSIQSSKYSDPGHILRIDFLKYLEQSGVAVDVYGSNEHKWVDYKGDLPYQRKDDGLFPYKYTFAAENNAIENYISEKLIDPIVTECLCFYWGAPNVERWINPDAYILLDLNDFEGSKRRIIKAMEGGEWERRLPIIRHEKHRILTELGLAPRVEKCLVAMEMPEKRDEPTLTNEWIALQKTPQGC